MIRRPPRSTLFPTRRSSDLKAARGGQRPDGRNPRHNSRVGAANAPRGAGRSQRSEEHTSELQSRRDLVCRLLLEKKKKKKEQLNDYNRQIEIRGREQARL